MKHLSSKSLRPSQRQDMMQRGLIPPILPCSPMLPLLLVPLLANAQQVNFEPFIQLLRPESMNRMAAIASELSSLAATNMRNNEKQIRESESDAEIPLEQDSRPSRLLGAAATQLSQQGSEAFIKALAPLAGIGTQTTAPPLFPVDPTAEATTIETTTVPLRPAVGGLNIKKLENPIPISENVPDIPVDTPDVAPAVSEIRHAPSGITVVKPTPTNPLGAPVEFSAQPSPTNPLGVPVESAVKPVAPVQQPNALLRIANAFLGGQSSGGSNDGGASVAKEMMNLGLKDFIPSADSNFGIPKGKGCLPFLSEFMQVAYGNCQQVADERAFDAWGTELRNAILTGQIDILRASQETCRRGAERQQCASLRRAIADCDIMKSLTVGAQLQRAMKRCEDVGGLVDQNPMVVLGQLNNLIGGEVAQGFFNNFLGGRPSQ